MRKGKPMWFLCSSMSQPRDDLAGRGSNFNPVSYRETVRVDQGTFLCAVAHHSSCVEIAMLVLKVRVSGETMSVSAICKCGYPIWEVMISIMHPMGSHTRTPMSCSHM
jgi:hypothetical protein